MARPLSAGDYGYDSRCYVCDPTNPIGLRIPFELSDDESEVVAQFSFGVDHSGVASLVHGGLLLAVLDEAQSWAVVTMARKWCLTRSTSAEFDGAVLVDHPHSVRAWITEQNDQVVRTAAVIADAGGSEVVSSSTLFTVLGDRSDPRPALRDLFD